MNNHKTLLFVDDDKDFLAVQAAFFRSRGYNVLTADGAPAAMELLASETPDLIFLDLMMDRSDTGFLLSHRIRQNPKLQELPIVMLSGVARATGRRFDREQSNLQQWAKLDAFVDKPVTVQQLLHIVEERLQTPH
jgi:CheY-like chemotaxis protein